MADFNSGTSTVATDPTFAAKGDILVGTADDAGTVLSVGTANYLLTVTCCTPAWTNTPTVGGLTVTGDITSSAAVDWDLVDDNTNALSFDATDKAGILRISSDNCAEGVTMSGTLNVTGTLTAASCLAALRVTSCKGELRLYESTNYVGFAAPALSADQVWTLPTADGSACEVLTTDGCGVLTWEAAGGISGLGSTDNVILRANGTGGATAQGSGVVIDDCNEITGISKFTADKKLGEVDASQYGIGDVRITASETDGSSSNILIGMRVRGAIGGSSNAPANTQAWTNAVAVRALHVENSTESGGSGAITGTAGLYIANGTAGGATITNQYGIYMEDLTAGCTDIGIHMGADLDMNNNDLLNVGSASNDITSSLAAFLNGAYQMQIGAGAGTVSTLNIHAGDSTNEVMTLENNSSSAVGLTIRTYRNEPTPADNDDVSKWVYQFNDDTSKVTFAEMIIRALDVTASTKDAEFRFGVQNNGSTGSPNALARLTSLGVWTDSSGEIQKYYEGPAIEIYDGRPCHIILDKILALDVGRYYSSNLATHNASLPESCRKPIRERHISPTAEQFYDFFGVGCDPRAWIPRTDEFGHITYDPPTPGLAPKDLAGVALWGIQELTSNTATVLTSHEARLKALEARLNG